MKRLLSCIVVLSVLALPIMVLAKDNPLALLKDANKNAAMHNEEGITHYKEGHWDIAAGHFKEATKADAKNARAHYNLALSLDMANKHKEAAEHFKEAAKLAPDDKEIQESKILKDHIK